MPSARKIAPPPHPEVAMSRRRSTAIAKLVSGGEHELIPCPCGAVGYGYSFSLFPMRHVARCLACGAEQACEPAPDLEPTHKPSEHTGRSTGTGWLPP
jgi:hypothetical protein